jgi:hypothetical protein
MRQMGSGAAHWSTDDESQFPLDFSGAASNHRLMLQVSDIVCHSSLALEKVLEHRFVAELTTALWLGGTTDFEILRGEVDAHGYDIVIEAHRIIRHIQLKAMAAGGRRRDVGVNLRLARKPSGCVIWIIYDPATLAIGPYLWFGGAPGEPLPSLGDRAVRHTRANAGGVKAERSAHRLVGRNRFTLLKDIGPVANALFGSVTAPVQSLNSRLSRDDQLALLRRHLLAQPEPQQGGWKAQVRAGDFSCIPEEEWSSLLELAHLVDGYTLAGELSATDPFEYANVRLAEARAFGSWGGGPAELWASLFLEFRRWRMAPIDPPDSSWRLIEELGRQLRQALS